jgi:hypothetical protein
LQAFATTPGLEVGLFGAEIFAHFEYIYILIAKSKKHSINTF